MGFPVGQSFSMELDGKKREFHVSARVLSDATVDGLLRIYRQKMRESKMEVMRELQSMASAGEIPADHVKELQREVVRDMTEVTDRMDYDERLQCAAEMLLSRDGAAFALYQNCEQIGTIEEANQIVDNHPYPVELFQVLLEAGKEGLGQGKNFTIPESREASQIRKAKSQRPTK